MARVAPLTPLRYAAARLGGDLGRVVAPPYDVISPEERIALESRDSHNVVRLILPRGEGDTKYAMAAELLAEWVGSGALERDAQPAFYRLEQTFVPPGAPPGTNPVTRRGFLGLVELVPYADRVVLPHERTLSGPKEDRWKLFCATRTNLSPGFMLYRDPGSRLDEPLASGEVVARFTALDGVEHVLSRVARPDAVKAIVEGVARSTLLIADGHHRYETALRYSQEVGQPASGALRFGEHRFFMTYLANGDDPGLVVFPTHRHVHSLASFSFDRLLADAGDTFEATMLPAGAPVEVLLAELTRAGAKAPALVAAVPDGRAALLTLRPGADLAAHPTLGKQPPVLRRTDVALLHAGLLERVLGITAAAQAAKTNLWYPQDARAALAAVRGPEPRGDVLFLMNATPVAQVRAVAEAGEVMPQKSTFFYPKVPTGLAIHTLDPARAAHVEGGDSAAASTGASASERDRGNGHGRP
ncbi:MAG TPA: DUF1015 domain-containing protein [Polyangiaceae bacterium]